MKRSHLLKLSLMAGTTGILLAGCSEPQEKVVTYADVDDCVGDGQFTPEQCQAQYQKALQENEKTAPRYDRRSSCEENFGYGRCESHGSFWTPFMAGFVMNMVARDVLSSGRQYYSSNRAYPVYRSSDDYFHYRTANNGVVGRVGQNRPVTVYDDVLRSSPHKSSSHYHSPSFGKKAATVSRGGFGRASSIRGGWGG